ncbi:MAG: type II secretion system protein [Capsulimonas sp.]|uniref:type II secretion system protein n=1 Tax=Capsulimonas sp. TaxID=2494211 RepID=UPI0032643547
MFSSRNQRLQRGVTWLELILLIATFAILIAVAVPVSGKLKERGKESSCVANMQHLGAAINQYVADNDGLYPMAWQGGINTHINTGQLQYWPYAIYPYVKDRHRYKCVNDTHKNACSYLINSWVIDVKADSANSPTRKASSISLPSRFVLLTEGMLLEGGDADPSMAITGHGLNTDYTLAGDIKRITSPEQKLPRHDRHLVFLYLDGHSGVSPELPEVKDGDYAPVKEALPFARYFDDRGDDWWQ